MKPWIIFANIFLILSFIGAIFGVSFGLAYSNNMHYNNQIKSNCTLNNVYQTDFFCCNKFCNTTIPTCVDLLKLNKTGKCCDINCTNNDVCYIICENCTNIHITYNYDIFANNVTVNCNNNQTCVNDYLNTTSVVCWYDKRYVNNLSFIEPIPTAWYIYYIIGMLCFLLAMHIIIIILVLIFDKTILD